MSTKKLNSEVSADSTDIVSVALSKIVVNGFNPRKTFPENELRELADSIRQVGVLQPVVVRPKGKKFEIVCGERRYRACVMAEMETIPAMVRNLTDDEALEIAITENLQRRDISPIEEAVAYKRLADTGRYDVASLAVRFGKSGAYIRNRIKLNDLTEEILQLVNEDVLSISVALELCKYSTAVQSDIYDRHLAEKSVSTYNDWRSLSAREFIKCLENKYCADLSRYSFDKSACAVCPCNTNAYSLFPENEGKCTELFCLQKKNTEYLVDACKQAVQDDPSIEIVQSPYRGNVNGEVFTELSEQGYMVSEAAIKPFPKVPELPEREQFEEQDEYEDAIEEYNLDCDRFSEKNAEIENFISAGKAKVMLTVDNDEIVKCYAILPENVVQNPANEPDEVQKLEKKDKRNREIAVENIVDDTKKHIRVTEIPQSDFTEFEDRMLYFVMLDDLKREHFALFVDNPQNRWHLTDEEKITVINNLTEEQMTLIRRDFLVKHLSNTYGTAKKSFLMLEFARLHFSETLAETENRYNEVYQKRHKRITERLEAIKAETHEGMNARMETVEEVTEN